MRILFRAGIVLSAILAGTIGISGPASATFKTVYSFCPDRPTCTGGYYPTGIYASATGDLYGTGESDNSQTPYATGFIFKLTHGKALDYAYSELFAFPSCNADGTCPKGQEPNTLVIGKSGAIYGTTQAGGTGGCSGCGGAGILFKISSGGAELVLHDFCSAGGDNCTDGEFAGGLTYQGQAQSKDWDETSPLYGIAGGGGASGYGEVFKYDPQTTSFSTVYNFCNGADCTNVGSNPTGLIGMQGKYLYGVDLGTGNDGGVVYKLDLKKKIAAPLHVFPLGGSNCQSADDGCGPVDGLLLDDNNELSGLTGYGGVYGYGVLWGYSLTDKTYKIFDNFCLQGCNKLGAEPITNVVRDSAGDWFGATAAGSANGYGSVFERLATGGDKLLHSFVGSDLPNATGPIAQSNGAMFWVSNQGGAYTFGAVYVVKPNR